jgi:hypothetical protein
MEHEGTFFQVIRRSRSAGRPPAGA